MAVLASACVPSPQPSPGPATPTAVVALPSPTARQVTVHVIGPAGNVSGASVCAARTGGGERCATSGADGRASLALVPGTYAVRAIPPAQARMREGVVTVDLTEDDHAVVTLEGRATISGTVRDAAGRAVGGSEVCAHGATSSDVECSRTRADGTYVVEVVPGIHKLEILGPPDGSRLIDQWARGRVGSFEADLIDTRSSDTLGVDIVLVNGVVMSGAVTAARDGAPVKEAQVCTYTFAAPLGWDCERTDENGRYSALREPGRYWVWVIPPGERGSRLVYQRYERVSEGVDASPFVLLEDRRLDVALTEGTVVHGRVTITDGSPVVLGLICVDTPFPTGRICRGTGHDGSYEVATRPQTYVVSVVPPAGSDVIAGYWPDAQPDWTKAGEIRVGTTDVRLDIAQPRGVRLAGTVRDARGAPAEGATINVSDASGPRFFGSTDILGRYTVAVLPGTYTVDVFAPRAGYSLSVVAQPMRIDVDAGYDVVLPDAAPE